MIPTSDWENLMRRPGDMLCTGKDVEKDGGAVV
jgi:hypothetical protein